MLMEIDLRNITVELLFDRNSGSDNPLARFDFIHSNLLVKIRSNGTKDVDLVSDEIRAVDTRYKSRYMKSIEKLHLYITVTL